MEIDPAPSTAPAPSPSATREGVSFAQAASAEGGGPSGQPRTPPSKKSLSFDEHARDKAAAIDAAGEHLAARAARERDAKGGGPRRFDGGKGGGGGRGGAQPSSQP